MFRTIAAILTSLFAVAALSLVPVGTASADTVKPYLMWRVKGKECGKPTMAKTVAFGVDVRSNKRGWGPWTNYKETKSADGSQKTWYDYQDRAKRADITKRCNGTRIIKAYIPTRYQYRTRTRNFVCYGLSCSPTFPFGVKSDWKAGTYNSTH